MALEQAIYNKEAPLRVAQSRLYLRSLRPNMELCRDQPQLRYASSRLSLSLPSFLLSSFSFPSHACSLEEEVRQLDDTLASLRQQLSDARGSLSHLEESRITLEKDINCKSHSLFIERDKCTSQRKRYPTISVLSGY